MTEGDITQTSFFYDYFNKVSGIQSEQLYVSKFFSSFRQFFDLLYEAAGQLAVGIFLSLKRLFQIQPSQA